MYVHPFRLHSDLWSHAVEYFISVLNGLERYLRNFLIYGTILGRACDCEKYIKICCRHLFNNTLNMSLCRSSKILKMCCVSLSVLCSNRHVATLTGGSE